MSRGATALGLGFGLALGLGFVPAAQAASPSLELVSPEDRSALRGEPARVEVVARATDARVLGVEVDGELRALILPWTRATELELEPGLHRVNLLGRALDQDIALRSSTAQLAVFAEAESPPLDRRARKGWLAGLAFVVAVGGAARLRGKGEL